MSLRAYLIATFCLLLSGTSIAASGNVPLLKAPINLNDKSSLQRGAKFYMNYCSGCHSLKYLRYNRMAQDIGLTTFDGEVDKPLLMNNLIFSKALEHDPIEVAMPEEESRQWFGVVPPDLTLEARVRGSDWIYTYLKSFYRDDSRPFGSNNLLIPGVAMPNVLAPLQGEQVAVKIKKSIDFGGKSKQIEEISHLMLLSKGTMSQHHFDQTVEDLVNFLTYAAEPVKQERIHLGWFVMIFLSVLLVIMYLLKKVYWARLKQPMVK